MVIGGFLSIPPLFAHILKGGVPLHSICTAETKNIMTEIHMSSKSEILIGTSGYSYGDWTGVLYPPGTKSSEYLGVYATEFKVAELNFSYYRIPDNTVTKRMADVTPSDFLFSVKAHKSLTHEYSLSTLHMEISTFLRGIDPLIDAGKLGVILLQFPFSFHYNSANRLYLDKLYSCFEGLPLAVEFRNRDWQTESVYEGLRQRNMSYVNVDEPPLPGLLTASSIITADTGYIRFHGRNKENWWKGDNVSRYDYYYSDKELSDWVPRIQRMQKQASLILIVFNNHSRGRLCRMHGG